MPVTTPRGLTRPKATVNFLVEVQSPPIGAQHAAVARHADPPLPRPVPDG